MLFPPSPAGRTVLLAGLLLLTVAACGRRGGLEAPGAQAVGGAPAAAGTAVEPDEERRSAGSGLGSPVSGERGRSARRSYTVPKDPFILDPLL